VKRHPLARRAVEDIERVLVGLRRDNPFGAKGDARQCIQIEQAKLVEALVVPEVADT